MCGRFVLDIPASDVAAAFDVAVIDDSMATDPLLSQPRYNICPTQPVLTIRSGAEGREAVPMRWGFLPHWYKTPTDGPLLINARSETIAEKPAFRAACRQRRCLIPASGFYEWRSSDPKPKTVFYFYTQTAPIFAFAGIWQQWSAEGHDPVETCAIVTCDANDAMRPIHHRLPVVIPPDRYGLWLGEEGKGAARLMHAVPNSFFSLHQVAQTVSNARSTGVNLIDPV